MDVYAVKWDEERVIKWLAVGMVLGLLAMAVMPVSNLELTYWMSKQGASPEAVLIADLGLGFNGLILSTAFGIASAGAGFVVGAAWLVGQTL